MVAYVYYGNIFYWVYMVIYTIITMVIYGSCEGCRCERPAAHCQGVKYISIKINLVKPMHINKYMSREHTYPRY